MLVALLVSLLGQDLKLPAEVRGQPNQFVTIVGETKGEIIKFIAVDPGLSIFPAELLATRKATVVTGPAGRYRVFCYTSIDNKPSDPAIVMVVIGDGAGPIPGPNPIPPPRPPEPDLSNDPLFVDLQSIAGGLQEPDQKKNLALLASVYEKASKIPSAATIGSLYAEVKKISNATLPAGVLQSVRNRLGEELRTTLGDLVDAPASAAKYGPAFARVSAILNKLAGEVR
jgi:hypothetical protein